MACTAPKVPVTPDSLMNQGVLAINRGDNEVAAQRFREVIDAGSETDAAAFARDSLRQLYGAQLYPETTVACSAEARGAFDAAEEQFATGHVDAALPLYRSAIDRCPDSAAMRVAAADASYVARDLEQARAGFQAAIDRDPWNRAAYRYLSDTETRLGNPYAAWEAATLAVLSDPLYEMGWVTLRRCSEGGPTGFRRVRIDKPYVTEDEGGSTIHLVNQKAPLDVADGGGPLWSSYAVLAANVFPDEAGRTHLETERARVDGVLRTYANMQAGSTATASPFWDTMKAANDAGFLDEAIYVHLMEPSMASEYAAFRDTHRERLVTYMRTLVAPPPVSSGPVPNKV